MSKIEHPTKPTIKSVRFKAISHFQFFFYFAKLEGKKLRKKPLVFPIPISSPDLTWFREDSGKPTPPLSFQRISVRVLQSTTILHENRREFFRGVFLSCLLFLFSWEKRNPNEPELLPLEGLRDDSGLVLLPLQGGLAGDTWVPQCDGGRYPGEK